MTDSKRLRRWGYSLSAASILGSATAASVCAVPLIAILLGVGGLGFLTQYADYRVPAAFVGVLFVAAGLWVTSQTNQELSECELRHKRRARMTLWVAAALAVLVNGFEFVLLPLL